jgi:two-component system chemotaxis response regulator CheY
MLEAHPELTAVFLDLNMPEMNGLEFLARRRADGMQLHVPVIMVTTEDSPDDERRGREAGAWEYLRKPFQPADIERTIDRVRQSAVPR